MECTCCTQCLRSSHNILLSRAATSAVRTCAINPFSVESFVGSEVISMRPSMTRNSAPGRKSFPDQTCHQLGTQPSLPLSTLILNVTTDKELVLLIVTHHDAACQLGRTRGPTDPCDNRREKVHCSVLHSLAKQEKGGTFRCPFGGCYCTNRLPTNMRCVAGAKGPMIFSRMSTATTAHEC